MTSEWRPDHSSDDDYDEISPALITTSALLSTISDDSTINRSSQDENHDNQIRTVTPFDNISTSSSSHMPGSSLTRTSSSSTIHELLRSAGIYSEIADSRQVQWRRQTFAANPDGQSGLLVSGTNSLYLDDDFFVFRDADGHPISEPWAAKQTAPAGIMAPIIDITKSNAKEVGILVEPSMKSKPKVPTERSKINKVKPKQRTVWKKVEIDVLPRDAYRPGPPEEKYN